MPEMTAFDVLSTLTTVAPGDPGRGSSPDWVQQAACHADPPKFGGRHYQTTAVNFFPEVTVRVPAEGKTRRGKPRLQRRRFDLVALVQTHYKNFTPLAIGVEIKVSRHDLLADDKLSDYLPYVHLFYLAVPAELEGDATDKVTSLNRPAAPAGLLLVGEAGVTIRRHPEKPAQPTDTHLKELYAELLLRPFKLAKKEQKLFFQFA